MTLTQKYHAIFDFKLVKSDFPKWLAKGDNFQKNFTTTKNKKRIVREKISQKKLQIAKKAARVLKKISGVRFVGVTGSLAMMNAKKASDIDLMIITKKDSLWITRLLVYGLLRIMGYGLRNPKIRLENNKLCLNMWLDEDDLVFRNRNIYIAHEIAQIIPLVNKDFTYEKFLYTNRWILDFWPYSLKINNPLRGKNLKLIKNYKLKNKKYSLISSFIELMAYKFQEFYMSNKVTRELVTPTRALFHPTDWGKVVLDRLNSDL